MVFLSILSISVESTEDDDIPASQIIRRLWSISACFLWGIGHITVQVWGQPLEMTYRIVYRQCSKKTIGGILIYM